MSQLDGVKAIAENAYAQAGIKQITIKDKRYGVQLLPAYTAFAVGMELISLALPALGSYIDSEKKSEFILPEEDAMFSEIALLLVRQMEKANLVQIAEMLLQGLTCNGQEVDANVHFRGSVSGFMQVLEFALKENFSDFFTDYLKEKGLKIRSLGEMMEPIKKEEEQNKSEE